MAIPNPTVNGAVDISAVSAGNAWLVGVHCPHQCATETTLIMHWNGKSWSRVASPNVAGNADFLSAVSASSARNAWAAGSSCSTTIQRCVPIMVHWNGTTWSKVASPAPGVTDTVYAASTISASDVWAVGNARSGASFKTVIFHWNGTTWSRVPSPDPGSSDALFGVAATSSSNAWAVGDTCTITACATLIAHWNGKTWSRVASSSPGTGSTLADVAATSSSNAWAVGGNCNNTGTQCAPIILHWNGKAWVKA